MDDTFVLTNVSPQVGAGFNRDYWSRFEKFIQDLATSHSDVWVVTGPLFLPTPIASDNSRWNMIYSVLGTPPRMMAVPTHFYKVVLAENSTDSRETSVFGAFVLPNSPINPATPLAAFTVPLSALEEAAGVNFFPKSLASKHRVVVDDMSLEWQEKGRSRLPQLQLSEHVQPLLLGAPVEGRQQAPVATPSNYRKPAQLLTTRTYVKGLSHVCEENGCRLPRERWWEGRKERPIRRSQSVPAQQGAAGHTD
jgi:endonuclease G